MKKQKDIIVNFLLTISAKRASETIVFSRNDIDLLKIDTNKIKSCLETLEMRGYIIIEHDISHDFLNDSYPLVKIKLLSPCFEYFKNKRAKKRKNIIKTVVSSASLILTVTYIISNITTTQRNIQEIKKNEEIQKIEKSPYVCDASIKWYDLDCVYSLLTNKSEIDFYFNNSGYYYNGICLYTLFSNKENVDRSIVNFTVNANDIVEDLSPRLSIVDVKDYSDPIEIKVSNFGWGETGKVCVTIKDISFVYPEDNEIAEITLNNEMKNMWDFPSILPGETLHLPFADTNIFNVKWKDDSRKEVPFNITVEAYIPGTDCKDSHEILMVANHENVYVAPPGRGGAESIEDNYGVVIDTSVLSH